MSKRTRVSGLSVAAYAAIAGVGVVAFALRDATEGRSFGLLALAGCIAIADCIRYFRRGGVSTPKTSDEVAAPLNAIAGIAAGIAFVVLGVLAATGVVRFE